MIYRRPESAVVARSLLARGRRPVAKYYLYRVTQSAAFTVPIFVLFFRSRGLSFAAIGLVEAIFTVVVLVGEVPTGYVGDRVGRRASMLAGTVLTAVGAAAFVLAHSLPAFALVVALRGVAATFQSGSREAWLYETLAAEADSEAFARASGRAGALSRASHAVAALVGSALYAVHPALPWLAEAAVVGSGALVLLTVPDSPREASGEGNPDAIEDGAEAGSGDPATDTPQSPRRTLAVARATLSRRALAAFVVYAGLLFGLLNTLEIYVQPVSVGVAGVAPAHLGALYAGLTLVAAVAAAAAGRVRDAVGVAGWFAAAPVALGAVLVAVAVAPAALAPALALLAFVGARAVGAVSGPLADQYLNDHADDAARATVLSGAGMVRSLLVAPLNVLGGVLAGTVALTAAMGALGALLAVGAAAILLLRFPVVGAPARE